MGTNQSLAKLTADATLSQLISAEPEAAHMLASIGLVPSEHKNETLRSVCKQRQWSEVEVLRWIKKNLPQSSETKKENAQQDPDYGDNLSRWCDYIEETFYELNLALLRDIGEDFPRVHQIHGNQYPRLKDMKWYFEQFQNLLSRYFDFMRKKFIPLVKGLQNSRNDMLYGTIRQLERSLEIIDEDCQRLQGLMDTISAKGRQFENPPGACSSLRILNQNFKRLFEKLEAQFSIEQEKVLPIIEQKIKGL